PDQSPATLLGARPKIPDFARQPALPGEESEEAQPPTPPVTIAFAGDVHGEPPIAGLLDADEDPFEGVAALLQAADLTVVNLETAVGTTGVPADKTFTFQADARLVERLADAGVDVVNLANNHALDFGHAAAAETRQLAQAAGLAVVGHGRDRDQAYQAHVVDIGGRTVAVVGLSRVLPLIQWAAGDDRPGLASAYPRHLDVALQAVRDAAAQADHVVVTIHWGQERWTCPDGDQIALAQALSQAGADVIAGHHPHVLQGVEEVDGTLVAYSLGNFLFYGRTPAARQSGVLTVTLGSEGVLDHTWSAAELDLQGRPQPVTTQAPIPQDASVITPSSGRACGPPS
ncbi:MAG TPA: CapA family protein, partial [Euzebya sp.]|nr:CapA family protein [Euzebya sp.]